ncbi:MAG TPA: mechanosensitive ion channel family protein [Flavobacteriales bacterium]
MSMWQQTILGQTLHDWLLALSIAAGGWVIGQLLYRISSSWMTRMAARTKNRFDDVLVSTLQGPAVVVVTLIGFFIAFQQLEVSARVETNVLHGFKAAWTICITWLVVRAIGGLLREFLVPMAERHSSSAMNENMLQLVVRSATVVLWGMGLIAALNNVGYDVSALIAGIGISGLALAMAAKDTVANLFGGVTVFADRPFTIGDRIRIGGYDGTVMSIGMRSTRIRTLEGPVVVVPNFKFTDTILENISEEKDRRVRLELGLTYDTTPQDMERAMALLSQIVHEQGQYLSPEHTVFFNAFKDWALNIVFVYRIRKGQDIEAAQSRVNLAILDRFATEGLEFAFPTQVTIDGDPEKKG